MGNNQSHGQTSSLGDKTNHGTFNKAFADAHKNGGSGHTFNYKGNLYTTNCKDGGDYRQNPDNRWQTTHKVHEYGHRVNAVLKDISSHKVHLDWMPKVGNDFGKNPNKPNWNSNLDRQRAEYHRIEAGKKN